MQYGLIEVGHTVRIGASDCTGTVVGVVNLKLPNEYRVHAKVITGGPNPPRLELRRFGDLERLGVGDVREACERYKLHKQAMRKLCLETPGTNAELWAKIDLIVHGRQTPLTKQRERLAKEFLIFLLARVEERKADFAKWFTKRFTKERMNLLTILAERARIQAGVM